MATWNKDNVVITSKGLEILSKVQAGIGSLKVTRIVTGGGYVSPSLLYKQTQVTEEKQQVTISKVLTNENGSEISVYFTNSGNESEYDLYQIGVYVKHEDYDNEVLYLIAQCDTSNPDHIPLPSVTVATFQYSIYMEHSSTQNVEVTVSQDGFITVNLVGSPSGVASLDSSGKIPVSQIPQLNYDVKGSAQAVQKNLNNHIKDYTNPHKVTAADVGAVPTSQKGTAGGVATLGNNGQLPYAQMLHLTDYYTFYVDPVSGDDTNPGTQPLPYRTIQAVINALPKDLNRYQVIINLKEGFYDETVIIQGFYGGALDYSILIRGDSDSPEKVRVRKFEIRSNTNFLELDNLSVVGTVCPSLNVSSSNAFLNRVVVKPVEKMTFGYSYSAVLINLNAYVAVGNMTIDLSSDKTFNGLGLLRGSYLDGYNLTIKNCNLGFSIGDGSGITCAIAALYNQPMYEGNTINCVVCGMGSITGGLTT